MSKRRSKTKAVTVYSRDEVLDLAAPWIKGSIAVLEEQNNYRLSGAEWDRKAKVMHFIFEVEDYFGTHAHAYYGMNEDELVAEARLYETTTT